jgi:hypothetical protein
VERGVLLDHELRRAAQGRRWFGRIGSHDFLDAKLAGQTQLLSCATIPAAETPRASNVNRSLLLTMAAEKIPPVETT